MWGTKRDRVENKAAPGIVSQCDEIHHPGKSIEAMVRAPLRLRWAASPSSYLTVRHPHVSAERSPAAVPGRSSASVGLRSKRQGGSP
ncbi:hypothetical protein RISK_003743 [Rhodopirellula islandica]|uniref:Uncharacterized protein n=1 Tax=Rhodopirellula islandica TaxID=595434 RepID=A0A0J1BC14_RHOIS|nr:hypothetical protein RISK_003743 [Rhodopirellula islandica]